MENFHLRHFRRIGSKFSIEVLQCFIEYHRCRGVIRRREVA